MALECVFTVLNVFCCVGESAPRLMLACNLQGLVAPECVSCRRERSNVHFDPLFTLVFEVLGVIFAKGKGRLREG